MQIGIELEYWVVDADGELARADGVSSAGDGVETEFVDQLLEVKTPPCETLAELREALAARLERALDAIDGRLVPLGTPLRDGGLSSENGDRIEIQRTVLGEDFEHAARCAGAHVHFEGIEPETQLRVLTALDPAFALVNTTPYHRGRRLVTCARPYAYRRLCYRRLPEHGRLWRYPDSLAEWRTRRQERYEAFREAAAEAGIDRARVRTAFDPDDAVWSPVRLRDDLGTVEWRAPDAACPSAILRLVSDLRGVLERAVDGGVTVDPEPGLGDDRVRIPPFGELESTVEAAMRRGLDAPRVVRHLRSFGIPVDAYRPAGARIDGLDRISAAGARRLRLRHADRLERDLRELGDADRRLAPA
jgi:gamma-glutamyl:cysteine ligase YbdK (ATP-grasp superfamily)